MKYYYSTKSVLTYINKPYLLAYVRNPKYSILITCYDSSPNLILTNNHNLTQVDNSNSKIAFPFLTNNHKLTLINAYKKNDSNL